MQNHLCAVAGKIDMPNDFHSYFPRFRFGSIPGFLVLESFIFLFLQIPVRLAQFRLIYVQSLIDPDSTCLCSADLI